MFDLKEIEPANNKEGWLITGEATGRQARERKAGKMKWERKRGKKGKERWLLMVLGAGPPENLMKTTDQKKIYIHIIFACNFRGSMNPINSKAFILRTYLFLMRISSLEPHQMFKN